MFKLCLPFHMEKELEYMENVVIAAILAVILGGAVTYLVKAKRSGVRCVGCPAGGSCSSKKPKKKKLSGPVIGEKTIVISGMECAHCAQIVTDSLNGIEGVRGEVDLSRGRAVVAYDREVDEEILKAAVERAGFKVVSVS